MSDERRDLNQRERFEDLKEAYALGALTGEEVSWFEGYLADHPELAGEVEELTATANLLALAPREYDPSPGLRRGLLAAVGGEQAAPEAGRGARLRGLFGSTLAAASAAAALVAVLISAGLLAWNLSLLQENEDLRAELAPREFHRLQTSGVATGASGEVIEIGDDRAVLMTEDLPSAPEDRTYQAWLMRNGDPEPAGLFQPGEQGVAAMLIEGTLGGAEAVAVTVEPSGGSSSPTDEPLMTANL